MSTLFKDLGLRIRKINFQVKHLGLRQVQTTVRWRKNLQSAYFPSELAGPGLHVLFYTNFADNHMQDTVISLQPLYRLSHEPLFWV